MPLSRLDLSCSMIRIERGNLGRAAVISLKLRGFALAAFMAAVPGMAAAADLPQPALPATAPAAYAPAVPDWIVTIGAEPRAVPAWPGASQSKFGLNVFPLFSVRKAGTPPEYFGARDSFGFPVLDLGPVKIGPAFKLVSQVNPSDYTELHGLAGVHYALQAGAFADYWPVTWLRLHGEVRQGFGGETGVTGDLFLDAVVPFGQFRWSIGPRITAQSTAALSPYFSITPLESSSSTIAGLPRLPVYNVSGGFYSYGAGTQLEYFFNDQWAAHAIVEYERLTDSAANSPLVIQRGSPNQFTFGVGATYAFSMHPWW
jgi:outer membrane protein